MTKKSTGIIRLLCTTRMEKLQGFVYLIKGTTPAKEAAKKIEKVKHSSFATRFVIEKQLTLRKMGTGVLLKNQMSVSQWYLYVCQTRWSVYCRCLKGCSYCCRKQES